MSDTEHDFLTTERLIFVPIENYEDYFSAFIDNCEPDFARILAKYNNIQRLTDKNPDISFAFAVYEKSQKRFIGICGLQKLEGLEDSEIVEIIFVIDKPYWRKGYGYETARKVISLAFQAGYSSIAAVTSKHNLPAIGLLNKLGFSYKGERYIYKETVYYFSLSQNSFASSKKSR